MTPSEFGSDHDTPFCSPRPPPAHAEPVFQAQNGAPNERTHTTSGVSLVVTRSSERYTDDFPEEKSSKPSCATRFP
jgi:AP-1-like factor